MKIAFFGAGNMARAISYGIFKKYPNIKMYFYTPTHSKAVDLAKDVEGIFIDDLRQMPKNLDWYFLGFKPHNLEQFNFTFENDARVVSMLAGTEIKNIRSKFKNIKIARIMPNTPSLILSGMNLIFFDNKYTSFEQDILISIFKSFGELEVVTKESAIDLLTPFTGSGPGILFEIATYFESSLKEIAGPDFDSRKLVEQTFLGTAKLMQSSTESFADLRDQVVSKKGVTNAAIESLRADHVEIRINEAFKKAIVRIEEMKRGL
jgi:pyrroline-5-carboxylate reductase